MTTRWLSQSTNITQVLVTCGLVLFSFCLTSGIAHAQSPDKSGVKPQVINLPSSPGSILGLGESFEPQLNTG
ncbi:MAG: hypothetical protein KDE53_41065, partial [Caldilineaceae bacterium]|nr:hypothetical protein [Caldilineaceae bacterium]